MSSFHQNARRTSKSAQAKSLEFKNLPCPICGRPTLKKVTEDCHLSEERTVRHLTYVRCSSCRESFFDVPAMATIERALKSLGSKRPA